MRPGWLPICFLALTAALCSAQELHKIGGDVSEPVPIFRPEPEYTDASRDARFSGTVLLHIVIDERGLPRDPKVVSPAPYGLDRMAVEAVMKWKFKPSEKAGTPVAVRAYVEVNFQLHGQNPGKRESHRTSYNHALALYRGTDIPRNLPLAFDLLTKAATGGFAPAQSLLGVLYYRGEGTSTDPQLAAHWFRKAAEQKDASAQAHLGFLYYSGVGVPQDDKQALKWLRPAAERNSPLAQHLLSTMYAEGRGIPADQVQALMWNALAVEQKHPPAMAARAGLEAKATPEQRREAQQRVLKFKPKK